MKVFLLSVGLSLVVLCSGTMFFVGAAPVRLSGSGDMTLIAPVGKLLTIPLYYTDSNVPSNGGGIWFGVDVNSIPATTVSFTQMSITRDMNDLIGKVSIKWTPAKKYIGTHTIRCFAWDDKGNKVKTDIIIKVK